MDHIFLRVLRPLWHQQKLLWQGRQRGGEGGELVDLATTARGRPRQLEIAWLS